MSVPSYMYQPESFGNEFSVLTYVSNRILNGSSTPQLLFYSDFLETLDDGSFFSAPSAVSPTLVASDTYTTPNPGPSTTSTTLTSPQLQAPIYSTTPSQNEPGDSPSSDTILPAATKTEKFLLTAADQESGSRDERLNRVIRSKYEAGLLKPYNYVKGYARLSRWMDRKWVTTLLVSPIG